MPAPTKQSFAADESGGITFDWVLQVILFGAVCALVLGSISGPQLQTASGDTHFNGYTITGQYP